MTEAEKNKTLSEIYFRVQKLMRVYLVMKYGKDSTLNYREGKGKVIRALQETGDISQKELASRIVGMTPQALGESLKKLEREGLVLRTPDTRDRRARIVRLTDVGKAADVQGKDLDEPFAFLSSEEQDNLRDYLVRLGKNTLKLIVQIQYDRDKYKGSAEEAVKDIEI